MIEREPEAPARAAPPRLLTGLSKEDRRDFLTLGRPVEVICGQPFMEEGERDLSLYLVLTGSVSTWRGGVQVASLGRFQR